jgi:putative hydrolase of the HAD superfamily
MASAPAYLLFDLDETLYPASSGLMQAVSERMNFFVAEYLGLSKKQAGELRRNLSLRHGTTLTGLMREHGLEDAERYLAYVHDVDVERILPRDPELAPALRAIPLAKSVLTNSPLEHALRVLDHLGVHELFERVFDIRFNGLAGKPDAAVYGRVLAALGRKPKAVMLIDNRLDYLLPFQALGGMVLLVDEDGASGGAPGQEAGVPRLRDVKQLPAFLGFPLPSRGAARIPPST